MQKFSRQLFFFCAVLMTVGVLFVFDARDALAYAYTATATAPIKAYAAPTGYGAVSWTEITAASSSIAVEVRAGNNADVSDGVWTAVANGQSLASFGAKQYIQTRIIFNYDGPSNMPGVSDISITAYAGALSSSVYDTKNYGNKVLSLSWTEQIPGSASVIFQMRTSPDNIYWTNWCGPDNAAAGCSTTTYFTDPNGGETIDADFATSSLTVRDTSDRYVQYKIFLNGDGVNIPIADNITLAYDRLAVVNSQLSPVKDTGQPSTFQNISWTANTPSETSVAIEVRVGATSTPDGTWTGWTTTTNGASLAALSGNRYIQHRINFSRFDPDYAPSVSDVTIAYTYNPVGSFSLTGSPFNTLDPTNAFSDTFLQWTETTATGTTDIKFQARVAPNNDNGTPGNPADDFPEWTLGSGWCGPATCGATSTEEAAADYFTANPAGETANPVQQTGVNAQWIQYKVWLETNNNGLMPILSDVRLEYVVNSPPQVLSVVAAQISDPLDPDYGKVRIDYEAGDSDTATGRTPGILNVDLEYCAANCSSPGSESWVTAATSSLAGAAGISTAINADGSTTTLRIAWNAKTNYGNQFNGTDFKVRIKANDSEGANNIAYAESNVFILDTRNPVTTSKSIKISALTDPAIITLSAADDSAKEYMLSLNSDLIGASWENFTGATTTATTLGLGASTSAYVRFRDHYGNESAIIQATLAETPVSVIVQDTSNVLPPPDVSDFRLFIAWKKSTMGVAFGGYHVVRSLDSGATWNLINSMADAATNYYTDPNVASNTAIWYRVYMTNNNESTSNYSNTIVSTANGVQDFGEGGGGVEASPPVISNVEIVATTTQSATIEWDTNEPANSVIGYSTTPGVFSLETGVATMLDNNGPNKLGRHRVVVPNLIPQTSYYFQVKSADASGNFATSTPDADGYVFTTKPGPIISDVAISEVSNIGAVITWNTNIPGNSIVAFSTGAAMASTTEVYGLNNEVLAHLVILNNLSPGTDYYYYVKTRDADGNEALADNAGEYYHFKTTNDANPPVISGLAAAAIADTSAVIEWITDERATARVEWGAAPSLYSTSTETNINYNINHAASLAGLTPLTKYYYRVISADASGNAATSSEFFFTTLNVLSTEEEVQKREEAARADGAASAGGGAIIINKTDQQSPAITNIFITEIGTSSALIGWTTDEPADSFVDYGETKNYQSAQGQREATVFHSVRLIKLNPKTIYHYRVTSADSSGNVVKGDDQMFETRALPEAPATKTETEELMAEIDQSDKSAAEKEEQKSELFQSAIKRAMEIVAQMAGHVSIADLKEGLNSQFQSIEDLAKVIPAPIMSSEPKVEVRSTEAVISWQTDQEANSLVAIVRGSQFNPRADEPYRQVMGLYEDVVRSHSVTVGNLEPDTLYHYQLRSKAAIGPEARSRDFVFQTKKEALEISGYTVKILSSFDAVFSWTTSYETNAEIKYTPYRGNILSVDQANIKSDPTLSLVHKLALENLEPGTTYQLEISSSDAGGNRASKIIPAFSTGKDEAPPAIDQLQADMAIPQGKAAKVQAIISWVTDEPSTSQVFFQKGFAQASSTLDSMDKTQPDQNYTKKHVAVITKFEPGAVYSVRVKSIDSSGNAAISKTHVVLAPKQKETVFQIIMKNFEQIFGWVGNVR